MSKVIVFCADGTWDGPGQPDGSNSGSNAAAPSNVFKLFANLAGVDHPGTIMLADEQERVLTGTSGSILQWSKYLHGVGDSDNFLVRLLGGTIGAGMIARIVRGYTFISRNYEPGDRIFIVGFSRGAYTARALAGMIANQGLLDAEQNDLTEDAADKENAYRLGSAVWNRWRQSVLHARPTVLSALAGLVLDLPGFMSQGISDDQLIKAPIDTVAVWDTVGSLGIPMFTLQGSTLDVFQFADTVLSPIVAHGIHAVAVDERRGNFTPTLWSADPRILQVLFPGCHGDIGGGYALFGGECGLSDGTLQWMTEQLTARGVAFLPVPTFSWSPKTDGPVHAPWLDLPWSALPNCARTFPPGLYLSEELIARAGLSAAAYTPGNLASYLVAGEPAPGITVV